jgi:hypothetical protein
MAADIQDGQIIGYICQHCGAYVARLFSIKAIDWAERLWDRIERNG